MNRIIPGISRRVITLFAIITLVIAIGTGGYMLIEGWSFFDGLYMTAITLSTIGYGEIYPLSERGRVFTLFLIIAGGTIFAYALSSAIEYALASGLADQLRRRRLMRTIDDSARTMNPSIHIVARSSRPENEAKLRRAGANSVVSPYQIGGRRMAHVLLRPNVTDFLDVVTLDNGLEIWLDEIVIEPGSPLMGQTVFEADLRRRLGVTLVALQRPSTQSTLQPDKTTRFEVGDHVIAVGTRPQIAALVQLAQRAK